MLSKNEFLQHDVCHWQDTQVPESVKLSSDHYNAGTGPKFQFMSAYNPFRDMRDPKHFNRIPARGRINSEMDWTGDKVEFISWVQWPVNDHVSFTVTTAIRVTSNAADRASRSA